MKPVTLDEREAIRIAHKTSAIDPERFLPARLLHALETAEKERDAALEQVDHLTPPIPPAVGRADGPEEVNDLAVELGAAMRALGLLAHSPDEVTRARIDRLVAMTVMEATDAAWWAATDDTREKMRAAYEKRIAHMVAKMRESLSFGLTDADRDALTAGAKGTPIELEVAIALATEKVSRAALVEGIEGPPPQARRVIPVEHIDKARTGDAVQMEDGVYVVDNHRFLEGAEADDALAKVGAAASIPPPEGIHKMVERMNAAGEHAHVIAKAVRERRAQQFVITAWDNTHRWFWAGSSVIGDTHGTWTNDLDAARTFDLREDAQCERDKLHEGSHTSAFYIRIGGRSAKVLTVAEAREQLKRDRETVE